MRHASGPGLVVVGERSQRLPARGERGRDDRAGVLEGRRLNVGYLPGRKFDHLDTARVSGDLFHQTGTSEQINCPENGVKRGAGGRRRRTSSAASKDVDALGTQLDRTRDWCAGCGGFDEQPVATQNWRKDPRSRAGRQDRIDGGPARDRHLGAEVQVEAEQAHRNFRVGQVCKLDIALNDLSQATGRNKVVALSCDATNQCAHADREQLRSVHGVPGSRQSPSRSGRLWARRDKGGVQRPERCRHHQVGNDALLVEGMEHARVTCASAASPREDKRGARPTT